MGREILFRGKQIDTGEWLKGYVFDDGICGSNRMFVGGLVITDYKGTADDEWEVGIGFSEVRPDTVSQYTGLKDKNGKMIFEGDIVFVTDEEGWAGMVDTGLGEVEMLGGIWYICGNVQNSLYDCNDCYLIEVLGNVHDNPELIPVTLEDE